MEAFRFQIGDLVILKVGIEQAIFSARMGEALTLPKVWIITGRLSEECSGGVQRLYGISNTADKIKVHEHEIIQCSEFDETAHRNAYVAGQHKMDAAHSEAYRHHLEKPA